MSELFIAAGIESWKPWLTVLFVSPLPLIVLIVVAASLPQSRRLLARLLILMACAALWLSMTRAGGELLTSLLGTSPELDLAEVAALKDVTGSAIVVLGGGNMVERLRYASWLTRTTNLPVAYSGGVAWGARPGRTEAERAAHVAENSFGFRLRWLETRSRDTRENSLNTVALLAPLGIKRIVLVVDGVDMPRALRNFERAGRDMDITIVPAPMGEPTGNPLTVRDWLPSSKGYELSWEALHECVGLLAGA